MEARADDSGRIEEELRRPPVQGEGDWAGYDLTYDDYDPNENFDNPPEGEMLDIDDDEAD